MNGATKLALVSGAVGVTGLALWVYAGVNAAASTMPVATQRAPARTEPIERPPSHARPPALVARVEPAEPQARQSREQLGARVRDPSHGHEPWDDAGLALLHALGTDAVEMTDVGCYMAGCMATFTFASTVMYRDAIAKLEASPDYAAWTGGKQLSAPETRADDMVVVAMVFERPD
jgi:hypothetical protein